MPSNNYRNKVLNNLNKGNESIIAQKNTEIVYNNNNKTLEEETVEQIAIIDSNNNTNQPSYRPVNSKFEGVTDLT